MRVKDASHRLPALSAAVEGRLPADGGWHRMLRSIRHRWGLSRRVQRSVRVDSVEGEDHGGILSCCGILAGRCVVLRGRVSCFGLQESGWGPAAKTWDTMYICSTKHRHHYTSVKWFFSHALWLAAQSVLNYWLEIQMPSSSHLVPAGIAASHLSTGEM